MVGDMMKNERNSDNPIIIWVGGIFWVPIACLIKPNTMTIRVKQVIIRTIAGATESMVSTKRIWSAEDTCCGDSASSMPKVTEGSPTAEASFIPNSRKLRKSSSEKIVFL